MHRNSYIVVFLAAILAGFLAPAVYAQQPQAPAATTPTVKAAVEEVLLDVVVRDKKGHRVDDLKEEDFQVFDNGEPKKITSFRLVQGGEAIGTRGTRTVLDPLRQIRLVTLIFQCGDTNSRRLAHDAAIDLLKGELPQNVFMAVETIDFKIEVIQAFTNDTALIRKGIERATRSENADFSKDTEAVRRELEQVLGPNTTGATSTQDQINSMAPTTTGQRTVDGGAFAAQAMAQMLLNMIRTEQSYSMADRGRLTIYSLLDGVKEQYRLPGRKTILYFTEGFPVPQELDHQFRETLSIANRANVSFYTVDARGLSTTSTNQAAVDMLRDAASSSRDQATTVSGPVRTDQANLIDTSINSTRANSQTALAELAESTGGTFIANTNDLRAPLHKLSEDVQTYYEITYNPEIKAYDGAFRKIMVKMSSNDLKVQSRAGYIALPPGMAKAGPLRAFEVPLLTALDAAEPPKAFDFEAKAMHFRGRQGEPVCEMIMDIPLTDVTLHKNAAGNQFDGRLAYVAVLKDANGEVVKKFQNERAFNLPADKVDGFKAGHFIYTEHFELPAGPYSFEAAVLDGEGIRISTRKSSLTLPQPGTTLALSSITFVRSTKDREASSQDSDPMVVGPKVISPEINTVLSKASGEALPFYMVIYPDKSSLESPQLIMEFSKDGQVLGRGPAQLGQPDKDGRIQFVASVPLARLDPGNFTLRFTVKQGPETAEEAASFVLK